MVILYFTEDPVHIFDHEPAPAHSVLKLVIDLFSRKKTSEHFYTNDVKVAIDIIVRQLADLSPGDTVSILLLFHFLAVSFLFKLLLFLLPESFLCG